MDLGQEIGQAGGGDVAALGVDDLPDVGIHRGQEAKAGIGGVAALGQRLVVADSFIGPVPDGRCPLAGDALGRQIQQLTRRRWRGVRRLRGLPNPAARRSRRTVGLDRAIPCCSANSSVKCRSL